MSSHLSPHQLEILNEYDLGEWSDEDFTALALEAGLSHARIQLAIKEKRQADAIEAEDRIELAAANGQFGMGA